VAGGLSAFKYVHPLFFAAGDYHLLGRDGFFLLADITFVNRGGPAAGAYIHYLS
jgi:hypothetical protein